MGQVSGKGEATIAGLANIVELAKSTLLDITSHACASVGWRKANIASTAEVRRGACSTLSGQALDAGGSVGGRVVKCCAC